MVLSDTIVENDSIFLENLCTTTSSSWVSGGTSAYMIYNIPCRSPLQKDHIYYFRCKYKYTTTNQKPTWVCIYMHGGMSGTNASVNNPAADTEYTLSGYGMITSGVSYALSTCHVYNGTNGAINGVTAQIKEMIVYDVTNLYQALLATATVSDLSTLITWCNTNLEWKAAGVRYDVTVPDNTKVVLKTGGVQCTAVECDGMEWYSVSSKLRNNTYFDADSGISVYNNSANGTVTHTRVSAKDQNSPFYPEHPYVLKITTNGTASPSCGGFVATHTASAGKIVIERFVAKVPVGYNVTSAFNSQGTGSAVTYLTGRAGTGDWAEYAILYKCGSSGSFSTGGHVYLIPDSGYSSTSVTWYLAYVNSCDITSDESLKNYTALNNKDVIKGNKMFSKYFNTVNILPNGDGSNTSMPLPSGWEWDSTDVPSGSKAKASIVQPVNAAHGQNAVIGGKIAINPHQRYKISMWIKSKQDMTSFLVAIKPYVNNTELSHAMVNYVSGTKTKLTADLTYGATQMTVSSNANWIDRAHSRIGFRINQYRDSWNTAGTSNGNSTAGLIKGVSGSTIVTFKTAYTGSTIAAGTFVVESYDGGVYPYPIYKENHPTDDTWKYVEGYFGAANSQWDGADGNWAALPSDCTHIGLCLNYYGNDGSVPIKYADIKIEELGTTDGERHMNLIQFKKFD